MKYGKEFQQILNDPAIPEDWRSSAIEYGRLKKLIKDVVAELSGMGLSPHVLHRLLAAPSDDVALSGAITPDSNDDEEILEFEFESPEHSPPGPGVPDTRRDSSGAQEVVVAPLPEEIHDDDHHHHRTFRLRLLSETKEEKAAVRPMGVMDMVRIRTEPKSKSQARLKGSASKPRRKSHVRRAVVDQHGAVKAEYVLSGDPNHLTPQLRLHVSTPPSERTSSRSVSSHSQNTSRSVSSHSQTTSTDSETEVFTSESEDDRDEHEEPITTLPTTPTVDRLNSPLRTPRAFDYKSPRTIPDIDVIPPSPSLQKLRQAVSPIWALATGASIADGLRDLSLDESQVQTPTATIEPLSDHEKSLMSTVSSTSRSRESPSSSIPDTLAVETLSTSQTSERDFIIPLASDMAFFNLLTSALTSLSEFHAAQQETFRASVDELCTMIRASVQPGSAPTIVSTPLTPSPLDSNVSGGSTSKVKSSKKNLYVWREIFSLWIEHEIFESNAERTRGERTVEEAQKRLQAFANEVVKRGLGDRRTIKGKKARGAWEEFLRLNVLLLDLKRFQLANINAARKILKKHDKRTALTASTGFPSFVRSTLISSVDKDGNISTWTFYNTSLPHVLLASMTDTLLPILPSLDDYACLICTSIAFKPIRLGCGHLFCVRCLVKMQRANKAECPLCRSKVVLLADKNSLDMTLMRFMKEWFPKEVKEKQRDNDREVAHEHAGWVGPQSHPSGGQDDRCVIM